MKLGRTLLGISALALAVGSAWAQTGHISSSSSLSASSPDVMYYSASNCPDNAMTADCLSPSASVSSSSPDVVSIGPSSAETIVLVPYPGGPSNPNPRG